MKSLLVKLNKKEYEKEIKGKKVYEVGGAYFCKKCCYRMEPQVVKKRKGFINASDIYLDMACQCEQLR